VPAREPLKACTSQPRISGYLARTHYLGPEGDGHPVALADITQCDNSSITSISDRRLFAALRAQALAPRQAQIRRIWRVGACDHLCTATVVTLVFLTGIDGAGDRVPQA